MNPDSHSPLNGTRHTSRRVGNLAPLPDAEPFSFPLPSSPADAGAVDVQRRRARPINAAIPSWFQPFALRFHGLSPDS
jgi:hypothetical protein